MPVISKILLTSPNSKGTVQNSPHVRRLLCGRFILYASCVVILNLGWLAAAGMQERLLSFVLSQCEVAMPGCGVVLSPFSAKTSGGKRQTSQEPTTVATNELEAPFAREERVVKLVGFLGTQAIHPFISLANDPSWPIVDGIPLLFQFSCERGPWEPIFGYSEPDLACVHNGQPIERVVRAMKCLTKHGDESLLDFIDFASLFRVPIGCGTKYRDRRLDLRVGPVGLKMTKVSFERICRS